MNGFVNFLLNILLGWTQSAANWFVSLFSDTSGHGALSFILQNWKIIAIVLIAAGAVIDFVIWMLRWRPYKVWASKLRRIFHRKELSGDTPVAGIAFAGASPRGTVSSETRVGTRIPDVNYDGGQETRRLSGRYSGPARQETNVYAEASPFPPADYTAYMPPPDWKRGAPALPQEQYAYSGGETRAYQTPAEEGGEENGTRRYAAGRLRREKAYNRGDIQNGVSPAPYGNETLGGYAENTAADDGASDSGYGDTALYAQPTQYIQPEQYGQPTQYIQPEQYGQPTQYIQPEQYEQTAQYAPSAAQSRQDEFAPQDYDYQQPYSDTPVDDGFTNAPVGSFGIGVNQPVDDGYGYNAVQPVDDGYGYNAVQPADDGYGYNAVQPVDDGYGYNAVQPVDDGYGYNAVQPVDDGYGYAPNQPSGGYVYRGRVSGDGAQVPLVSGPRRAGRRQSAKRKGEGWGKRIIERLMMDEAEMPGLDTLPPPVDRESAFRAPVYPSERQDDDDNRQ
ncbi:MAG: hypothetical protein PHI27_02150 [Eubacteriales bacterium]|nr:hypothetical protein [Eubacteriales bacterium]MDD4511896.1 hypothetical protein [Eubacteriales bacterium]